MFFPHCPLCRGRMKQKTPKLFVCAACGYHFFDDPHGVTMAILENHRGEILLVKRKFAPKKGLWDTPGGFIEQNESAEDGMRRELFEELRVSVGKLRYVASYPDVYRYKGVVYPTLNLAFIARMPRGAHPVADDDAAELRWFSRTKIPWKKLAFKCVERALRDWIASSLRSSQ